MTNFAASTAVAVDIESDVTMSLSVDRVRLLAAVQFAASSVIERRNTIPIISNVMLRTVGDRLFVRSTDLDISLCQVVGDCSIAVRGATTVPAAALAAKLGVCESDRVSIVVEDGTLTVSDDDSSHWLSTIPADEFPTMSHAIEGTTFETDISTLAADFAKLLTCASTEETRYYLNGVHVSHNPAQGGSARLLLAATDGHRLARIERPVPVGAFSKDIDCIIPRKTVGLFVKLAKLYDGYVDVSISKSHIVFTMGDTVLGSKLIDGTFPDYHRVIPQPSDNAAIVDVKDLMTAGKKLAKCASDRSRAFKMSAGGGKMTMTVFSPENGTSTVKLACKGAWPHEFGFNGAYLTALAAIHKGALTISSGGPSDPCLITSSGAPELATVLMPMRL